MRQSNVIAGVFQNSGRRYHYFCKYPIQVNDYVIVDSPYNGYTCVKVVEVLPQGSVKASKSVVQVVDDSEYVAELKLKNRKAEIEKKLEKRAKEYSKEQFYKQLADMDPVAKELFAELQDLAA